MVRAIDEPGKGDGHITRFGLEPGPQWTLAYHQKLHFMPPKPKLSDRVQGEIRPLVTGQPTEEDHPSSITSRIRDQWPEDPRIDSKRDHHGLHSDAGRFLCTVSGSRHDRVEPEECAPTPEIDHATIGNPRRHQRSQLIVETLMQYEGRMHPSCGSPPGEGHERGSIGNLDGIRLDLVEETTNS